MLIMPLPRKLIKWSIGNLWITKDTHVCNYKDKIHILQYVMELWKWNLLISYMIFNLKMQSKIQINTKLS